MRKQVKSPVSAQSKQIEKVQYWCMHDLSITCKCKCISSLEVPDKQVRRLVFTPTHISLSAHLAAETLSLVWLS
jgi:hypothetical protein